jgi:hypothetical protein
MTSAALIENLVVSYAWTSGEHDFFKQQIAVVTSNAFRSQPMAHDE